MRARFYLPDLNPGDTVARLSPAESHHLTRVLRLTAGDIIRIFDGRGAEWLGRVDDTSKDGAAVSLLEPVPISTPPVALRLVQSVLKGAAMDAVIRDCTMVGVAAIQPVLTGRTTVKSEVAMTGPARWRRIALAAAKQCGAARLPEIHDVLKLDAWLQQRDLLTAFILLEPGAQIAETVTARHLAARPVPSRADLFVGPEGGWEPEERDHAIHRGCTPLSLGPMTLRADAVPLAATATLLAIWTE